MSFYYKPIAFSKAASSTSLTSNADNSNKPSNSSLDQQQGESTKQFYLSLLEGDEPPPTTTTTSAPTMTFESKRMMHTMHLANEHGGGGGGDDDDDEWRLRHAATAGVDSSVRLFDNDNMFLRAVQADDLKYVRAYLSQRPMQSARLANICDEFKWNALMIAVASHSNKVVGYLLTRSDRGLVQQLLAAHDVSGHSAESLALICHNRTAAQLIENAKQRQTTLDNDDDDAHRHVEARKGRRVESNAEKSFYCDTCGLSVQTNKQTYEQHVASIAHQLSAYDSSALSVTESGAKKKTDAATFWSQLRPSNKGYQLLVKAGWDEASGLGAQRQGQLRPIKTTLKLDRHGIGLEADQGGNDDDDAHGRAADNANSFSMLACNNDNEAMRHKKSKKKSKKSKSDAKDRIEDEFSQRVRMKQHEQRRRAAKSSEWERHMRYYFNN